MYLSVIITLLIVYFIWDKIIYPYYLFFYFTRQGVPYTAFPLPIVGNSIRIKNSIRNRLNEYNQNSLLTLFYEDCFP